ncbi:MAG: efflux RND transporter permease subunit [Thermodesulfobacteriota bacterium]
MDIVGYSIHRPVSVTVGVILVVLFGLIGLNKLPVQLTPDVEAPQITVNTTWAGATPYEVEKEIIEKQEETLKGLRGLTKMESAAYNSRGEITLTFNLGTDLDDALLRVSNKMNEVADYPENVDKPVIEPTGANSSPVIWMMLEADGDNPESIDIYRTFFENNVRQAMERVEGVGSLFVFGGTEDTLDVTLDMAAMARRAVTVNEVMTAIRTANQTISAGVLGVGRKNYRIRTTGQFQNPEEAMAVVIRDDGLNRVLLRDIATVEPGHKKKDVAVLHNGKRVIVVAVRREPGANVLAMTDRMEEVINGLNATVLKEHGLHFRWVYDQRPYIDTAIGIVKQNVLVGGLLAVAVLFAFLRSVRFTLATALAIPISVIGTFVFLWLMGRNLNVVSLAGISFAVGMLVDNAIVVLENIDRHRQMGKTAYQAAYEGTQEVWGAVLASTATTVAVFLPVIFMEEEAGQLFRDIAIAITFSILLSLFVSISVIPSVINVFYRNTPADKGKAKKSLVGAFFMTVLMGISDFCLKNAATRIATIVLCTGVAAAATVWLLPSAEYLPQGNRNLVMNILIPPPGYSIDKMYEMGEKIFRQVEPHMREDGKDGVPRVAQLFFVGGDRFTLFGGLSAHETRAREMMPLFNRIMKDIPGVFGVSIQRGIFESGIGQGRTVEVNIAGENIEEIVAAGRTLFASIGARIEGAQIRPVPSLETSYPEARLLPDRPRLAANRMSEADLGRYADILMDGRKIDEYRPEGIKQVDLVLKGSGAEFSSPESLLAAPLVNGLGRLITLGDVARLVHTEGMPQINHLERRRTVTLQVTPPTDLPLQQAMETISDDIVPGLRRDGKLPGVAITIGGNADKLIETRQALQWNLLLAVAITYLLMSALFENFLYPLIILFSVPLAGAGGFIGLDLVNRFIAPQGFDVLAMLGFIILVGTVVNNAILIVHQALNNVRYNGLAGLPAISDAVRTRIRPIFMSAITSLFGMLPLVLSTGQGSELYRGLGSILLGGLALSTVFTLFVIPSLLAFFIGFERSRANEETR